MLENFSGKKGIRKMKCNRGEMLSRYIDNDLEPCETSEFREHLAHCLECKLNLQETRERENTLRKVVLEAFPTGSLAEKVMPRIRQEAPNFYPRPEPSIITRLMKPWVLIPTLSLGLTIIIVFFFKTSALQVAPGVLMSKPSPVTEDTVISVAPLSENSRFGYQKMTIGESIRIAAGKKVESYGFMAFHLDPRTKNQVNWDGQGVFAMYSDRIEWESGAGAFHFKLNSPVTLQVGKIQFMITGTMIRISGKINSPVKILLEEGAVDYDSPAGKGALIKGVPMVIRDDKVEKLFLPDPNVDFLTLFPMPFPPDETAYYGHNKDPDRETDLPAKKGRRDVPNPFHSDSSRESFPVDLR